jgi:hypothetical protein
MPRQIMRLHRIVRTTALGAAAALVANASGPGGSGEQATRGVRLRVSDASLRCCHARRDPGTDRDSTASQIVLLSHEAFAQR